MSKIVDIVLSKYQYALKDFEIEEKEAEIYIRMITIKRGMKRKGIGSAIVREVQEYAKSKKKLLRLIVVGTWRERISTRGSDLSTEGTKQSRTNTL